MDNWWLGEELLPDWLVQRCLQGVELHCIELQSELRTFEISAINIFQKLISLKVGKQP